MYKEKTSIADSRDSKTTVPRITGSIFIPKSYFI